MELYENKSKEYFSNTRHDLIKIIEEQKIEKVDVLEIGAGGGYTLLKLKELGIAKKAVGFELFDMPNTEQKNKDIDEFIIANVETSPPSFPKESFDLILLPDVLEHLVDPWQTLSNIEPLLRVGGHIIISIPNIREISTLKKIILHKDFRYENEGILDKTHLRFFCKKNALELIKHLPSLQVKKYYNDFEKNIHIKRRRLYNTLTFGLFADFLTVQHLILIEKIKS